MRANNFALLLQALESKTEPRVKVMRIGISIITQAGHNIWNNGIGQNVYHLATLLDQIPFVERVVLINTGDQNCAPAETGNIGNKYPLISLEDASDAVDVAIEMSGALDYNWSNRFRGRGGRVIFHNCGHPYLHMVEPMIFNKPAYFGPADRCDAIWCLPKDEAFIPMYRSMQQCPADSVPYLWSPVFLEKTIQDFGQSGCEFGYKEGLLKTPTPAIFEPNISPGKMGVISLLICEAAYSADPSSIDKVWFMNGEHMASHPTFIHLVERHNLYADGKLAIAARDYFAKVMMAGSNIVVSHQLDWTQNYVYLDAIYGNYPLIHNSPLFDDVGYYYPDSRIDLGMKQYLLALAEHDKNLNYHKARNAKKMHSVSPLNRANRDIYARRLLDLETSK